MDRRENSFLAGVGMLITVVTMLLTTLYMQKGGVYNAYVAVLPVFFIGVGLGVAFWGLGAPVMTYTKPLSLYFFLLFVWRCVGLFAEDQIVFCLFRPGLTTFIVLAMAAMIALFVVPYLWIRHDKRLVCGVA